MPTPPPTWLERLEVSNFRCFDSLVVDFDPHLNVLVGINGGGKTALLDAIAVAMRCYVDPMEWRSGSKGLQRGDVRRIRTSSDTTEPCLPTRVKTKATFVDVGSEPVTWNRELRELGPRSRTVTEGALELRFGAAKMQADGAKAFHDNWVGQPDGPAQLGLSSLVVYYGTGRLLAEGRLSSRKKSEDFGILSRQAAFVDCLSSGSKYKLFLDWFERFSRQAQVAESPFTKALRHDAPARLEAVRTAVDKVLEPIGWGHLAWDFVEETIVARHPEHGIMEVGALSDGVRGMLGLVGDLAHRCVRLNPQLGTRAALETPGIVLIDEVDLHLHPDWQQSVIESLRNAFPQMQFIVTTHSPQVLTTVRRENIRVLGRDAEGKWRTMLPDQSPFARESKDALAVVMGVDPLPLKTPKQLEVQNTLRQFEQLVRRGQKDSPRAFSLRKELEDSGYEIPAADLALWEFLATAK